MIGSCVVLASLLALVPGVTSQQKVQSQTEIRWCVEKHNGHGRLEKVNRHLVDGKPAGKDETITIYSIEDKAVTLHDSLF